MNHRYLFSLVAAMVACAFPLAASQARTFQDGLKKAGSDKPLVVLCYGANFDKFNTQYYEKYFKVKNHELGRVYSKETFVVVPVYQQPTDAEKREYEKVMGKRGGLPGVRTYPSILVLDGNANFRGAVDDFQDLETPEKAAAALSRLLEDFRKQQKLLSQAEHSKGANKTRLTREALSISNVRAPQHGMYDPSNNGLVQELQIKSLEDANAHVRHIIANGNFSRIERQMILVAYAGHLRRNKGSVARLRAIFTEIRNIDPDSIYGHYAEGALKIWVEPLETEAMNKKDGKDK